MEERNEVKVYKVKMICENCGNGYMNPTGVCLTSYPAQYPHKCEECGAVNYRKIYPYVIYE